MIGIRHCLIAACLAVSLVANAESCYQLATMVHRTAELRDQGVSQTYMEQRMKRELKGWDRKTALSMIKIAFESPQLSPDQLSAKMLQTCLKH